MNTSEIEIRNAKHGEHETIGKLMVTVYSQLEGFPNQDEQPHYYSMLLNVGQLSHNENTELIVAVDKTERVVGAVVYFTDMKNYGSGGTATQIKNASGFRLLAVDPVVRGKGIGKLLCIECVNRTKRMEQKQLYIHSTESMKIAWGMYERLGFERYTPIDFKQGELPVFGFVLNL